MGSLTLTLPQLGIEGQNATGRNREMEKGAGQAPFYAAMQRCNYCSDIAGGSLTANGI